MSSPQPQVRFRRPPIDRPALYGDFASEMIPGEKLHQDISDRAAYMFITGCYPSHLRSKATGILRQITHDYRRPTSIDDRKGNRMLFEDAIRDLRLNSHEMVKAAREKVSQGYVIEPNRGMGTRRGFSKVFMFKKLPSQMIYDKITITLEGAVKQGWD